MSQAFRLILASRRSPLALWQAAFVARHLRRQWPGLATRILPITASGDTDTTTPLYGMGGIGVFSKEVHAAVLAGEADLAVHSCKDLPTQTPDGIAAPILMRRHDPRDALIGARSIAALPPAAIVGTSSLRRRAQLAEQRPDLGFVNIRGNVSTRLQQLRAGHCQATLLACAGLQRLASLSASGAQPLHPVTDCIPAVAQGALAIDHRRDDRRAARLLAPLACRQTTTAVGIERAVLAGLRGGCSLPLGCWVRANGATWLLDAFLQAEAGPRRISLQGAAAALAERALLQLGG